MTGKRKRNNKKRVVNKTTPNPDITPTAKNSPKWKITPRNLLLFVGGVIGFIATIQPATDYIRGLYLKPHEKYEEENFISGELIGTEMPYNQPIERKGYELTENNIVLSNDIVNNDYPKVTGILIPRYDDTGFYTTYSDLMGVVILFIGDDMVYLSAKDLQNGLRLFSLIDSPCSSTIIDMGVVGNRLYISTEFKDLAKEETIGIINYNQWKLYKANMLDFYSDDKRLVVKDKQNNIVFSISYYDISNQIHIAGYFINPNSVLIIKDSGKPLGGEMECISKSDSNWKAKAALKISSIKVLDLRFN